MITIIADIAILRTVTSVMIPVSMPTSVMGTLMILESVLIIREGMIMIRVIIIIIIELALLIGITLSRFR